MTLLAYAMPYPDVQKAAKLIDTGQAAEAVELLLQARSKAPSYVTPRILLAKAFTALGNRQEAGRMWLEARALLPGNLKLAEESIRVIDPSDSGPEATVVDPDAVNQHLQDPLPPGDAEERSRDDEPSDPSTSTDRSREPFDFLSYHDAGEPESDRPDETGDLAAGRFELDSLDDLIDQLENAPRITPKPAGEPHEGHDFISAFDDEEEIVSETLARIYVTQKQYGEAARVYAQLAEQHPDRCDEFLSKARECLENAEERD